ncbi:MAG: rhomboid family intramembrane serine protease, partial [bacterium]
MKYKCNSCGAKVDIGAWKSSMLINPNARVAGIYKCGKCGSSDLLPMDGFISKIKKSEISFALAVLFFIGLLLGLFYPEIVSILELSPERSLSPLYWYTFFTYSFIHIDIFHFLFISLSIVFSGLIIEKYLSRYIMIIIIIGSMILGGIIYCLITPMSVSYIGGNMISYGYIGALLVCW